MWASVDMQRSPWRRRKQTSMRVSRARRYTLFTFLWLVNRKLMPKFPIAAGSLGLSKEGNNEKLGRRKHSVGDIILLSERDPEGATRPFSVPRVKCQAKGRSRRVRRILGMARPSGTASGQVSAEGESERERGRVASSWPRVTTATAITSPRALASSHRWGQSGEAGRRRDTRRPRHTTTHRHTPAVSLAEGTRRSDRVDTWQNPMNNMCGFLGEPRMLAGIPRAGVMPAAWAWVGVMWGYATCGAFDRRLIRACGYRSVCLSVAEDTRHW